MTKKLMGSYVAPDWHYVGAEYTDLASALADTDDHWSSSGTYAVLAGYIGYETGDFLYDGYDQTSNTYSGPDDGGFPVGRFQWESSTLFTATATLVVPTAGNWTIALSAAEGSDFVASITGNGADFSLTTSDYSAETHRAVKTFNFPVAGAYSFSMNLYRNAAGSAYAELSCAPGTVAPGSFSTDTFTLIGIEKSSGAVAPNISGISIDGGKVTISIDNAAKGRSYGYKFAAKLEDLDDAETVWLDDPAAADGALFLEMDRSGSSGFYKIVVAE